MDLMNSSSKTVDALMKLDMPAGVDIEIKTQDIINLFLEERNNDLENIPEEATVE